MLHSNASYHNRREKLPPYVVFKRKMMAKEMFPQGIIVRVQKSGL
jgi:hypothetical protein